MPKKERRGTRDRRLTQVTPTHEAEPGDESGMGTDTIAEPTHAPAGADDLHLGKFRSRLGERRQQPRRGSSDRRESLRVPIDLWMEEVRGDEIYFRRSCNLSEGGVLFEQSIPYPVGTRVHLRFTLPGYATEIATDGEVMAAAQVNNGLGMGLRFVNMTDSAREQISSYLSHVLKERAKRSS